MTTNTQKKAEELMQRLDLQFMQNHFESWISNQTRSEEPLMDSIVSLLELEHLPRTERQIRTRLKVSGIPVHKRLEDYDLSWPDGGVTEKKFRELKSLAFIERKENVIFMGPSGLGKTHLLQALGYKACHSGYSAYFMSCLDAMDNLVRARDTGRLKQRLKWMRKPNVLLIDEIGYENLNPEDANLFFQMINTRYEHGSIIMTTNRAFSGWGELLGDDAIATATLDRLLHHAHVISLKGKSYRMKGRLKKGLNEY
jgi:DNA replication protein DnaC